MALLLAHISKKDKVVDITSYKAIHQQGLLHREVDLLIMNHFGILLQQKKDNGKWRHWSGHVIYKEQGKDAAVRIFEQDTGFQFKVSDIKNVGQYSRCTSSNNQINNRLTTVYVSYQPIVRNALKVNNPSIKKIRYFSRKEIRNMIKGNNKLTGGLLYVLTKVPVFLHNCIP